MYRLSSITLFLLGILPILAQSPHGEDLVINCAKCHDASGWSIDYNTIKFDHNTTDYNLEGAHAQTDCKQCHETLVFNEAPSDCVSCHTDVHNMSVGNDCARCHTPQTWLVDNIPEIHEENGFPLIGAHSNLSCVDCHSSETNVRFSNIGNECISCHQDDYASTQSPSHTSSGFSTNCIECHDPFGMGWDTDIVNHDFFPLTLGHDIQDCNQCHTTGNFSDADPNCVTCHQDDYAGTQDPNHQNSGFSTNCVACHTTNPGWSPAGFGNHDFFPLTLGHDIQDCNECHTTGNFSDADPNCVTCHQDDYSSTANPNHTAAGFSTDCVSCHTTNPGWTPAVINHDFFPLTLGHDIQDCNECHTTSNFSDADPNCVTCHQDDYNGTNNPNHQAAQFPVDCVVCHTTNPDWTPATFDHDGQYFPIYSGKHKDEWNECIDCHTDPNNFSTFSCFKCHGQSETNNDHSEVSGYTYNSNACLTCHPTGED